MIIPCYQSVTTPQNVGDDDIYFIFCNLFLREETRHQ